MKKIKLFCFPHAGGSSVIFQKWESYLPANIELCPVELASRGRRISEPLYQSMTEAVGDLFRIIKPQIQTEPYAFFGHSMGAVIAFELARRIRKEKIPAPLHLFFSGKEAPHTRRPDEKMFHRFPEEKFKEEVIKLGGATPEIINNPKLLDLLMPVLKNDFIITETYDHRQPIEPFAIDFTLFIGREDDLTTEEVTGWLEHTKGVCTIHYFPGDHFFIHKQSARVVELINRQLSPGAKKIAVY
ncbi:MAG: thioesterase domain-containing protein [Candidatus Aminicenantes bacterium]|nr:thioesterase domain-containing protein [Candidatus Aminicenantes bacterium]